MGKGKGTGSGRPPKERPKRISGTGYTKGEAAQLKYKREAEDGSWEIDTDAIDKIVQEYVDEEKRTRERIIRYKDKGTETEEYLLPISRAGLRAALRVYNTETYSLWLDGYVNREHKDNEGYAANLALSEALRAGDTAIARWLCEQEDSKHSSRTIRLLETMGEITPSGQKIEIVQRGRTPQIAQKYGK